MKAAAAALAVAVSLLALHSAAADRADADNADADAVAALAARADMRARTQACEERSEAYPWQYKWYEYFWEAGNLAAFQEADAVAAAVPAERHQALQDRVDAEARRRGLTRRATSLISLGASDASSCRELTATLGDHAKRHEPLGPGVFERLSTAYATRRGGAETVRREVQRQDMVDGCAKSQVNSGRHEFEPVLRSCTCIIDAIYASATSAEVDAYVEFMTKATHEAVAARLQTLPWWSQKAVPRMKACLPAS